MTTVLSKGKRDSPSCLACSSISRPPAPPRPASPQDPYTAAAPSGAGSSTCRWRRRINGGSQSGPCVGPSRSASSPLHTNTHVRASASYLFITPVQILGPGHVQISDTYFVCFASGYTVPDSVHGAAQNIHTFRVRCQCIRLYFKLM